MRHVSISLHALQRSRNFRRIIMNDHDSFISIKILTDTPRLPSDQNPCHLKIVGPTLGFVVTVVAAVCYSGSFTPGAFMLLILGLGDLLARIDLLWMLCVRDWKEVSHPESSSQIYCNDGRALMCSV
jgi:hypothetical protein